MDILAKVSCSISLWCVSNKRRAQIETPTPKQCHWHKICILMWHTLLESWYSVPSKSCDIPLWNWHKPPCSDWHAASSFSILRLFFKTINFTENHFSLFKFKSTFLASSNIWALPPSQAFAVSFYNTSFRWWRKSLCHNVLAIPSRRGLMCLPSLWLTDYINS